VGTIGLHACSLASMSVTNSMPLKIPLLLPVATANYVATLKVHYGRQPSMCSHGNGSLCHAPHLHEEWWVGPASGEATSVDQYRRPYRLTKAAPRDAFLMSQPVPFQRQQLCMRLAV
jgi:hypothetical protein